MSSKKIDQESQEMLRAFVSEALDSLDTNEPLVENLLEDNNSEYVNGIFRVFHTLKGLSGFFEMKVINKVTHEAETLLDIIRKQDKPQNDETLSVIYMSFDFLRDLLQRVNDDLTDESGRDEAEDIILVIKDTIKKVQNVSEEAEINPETIPQSEPVNEELAVEEILEEIVENDIADDTQESFEKDEETLKPQEEKAETKVDKNLSDEILTDEMLENYLTSAFEFIENVESNLLRLEKEPANKDLIARSFADMHSMKGNSGFMGFNEIEELAIDMESILDSLRAGELEVDETVISVLLSNLEMISDRVNKLHSENKTEGAEKEPVIKLNADEEKQSKTSPAKDSPAPQAQSEQAAVKTNPASSSQSKEQQSISKMQRKDIRVETSKIDKLFDLVGELITIESMVTNNPDLKGYEFPNFNRSANMLNKITRELQEITMSVRMMPLDSMFNKMKRLVRDVSMKMGKKINFTISGQDTEMDKNVIDEIADPLVHILRNALDHGVESPEERIAKGKDPEGNVSLSAKYEGNEILIIIEDDGAGIDRSRILKKAGEKGLLTQEPEKMSDRDVFLLLFEPGFSTAATVTDISGRGVGMDVVKKNIEKLRGSVDVESKLGKGSRFVLRIPLTLAIMEAMVIRIGKSMFALPILSVTESFKADINNISSTMDGLELIKVREEILPIIRLNELFHKNSDSKEVTDGILITIESRSKKVCLFADEIIGQQQAVIKSLTDYIGKVPGLMGCMILGDGSIGLIIDIESLLDLAELPVEESYA